MTRYFGQDMVDSSSNRFYYYSYPSRGESEHFHFPIRDLAAAWDATKALDFSFSAQTDCGIHNLRALQYQLADATRATVEFYCESPNPVVLSKIDGGTCLNEDVLREEATIGHSALLLLAWSGASRLGIFLPDEPIPIDSLTKGILAMQLESGAFGCTFKNPNEYLKGIEFFPGEAMLALMHVYDFISRDTKTSHSLDTAVKESILPAMERAFKFYSRHYEENELDVNYNIWQAQAFAKYYDAISDSSSAHKDAVSKYVLDLCHGICQSKSWKYQLARGSSFYVNLETIEIGCGLDALVEGMRIAQALQDDHTVTKFRIQASNAARFVAWVQDQVPQDSLVGHGGLGYGGIQVLEQRLDVTGHGLSAMNKLHKW
eukprot:CAMPEP_0113650034 /NCGR_PEP_ID=MMETSP0017_2-20120614/26612_1 /TAXON_ID=2856 /ORGANISM="Cylindrotheca closterium" /LENGTH=373 /DNA_ID=CAMNT_0000562497 /DNA_START=292 /DNA_END=1411 /DNA_ORIENTATION=+ /assembly_acc=CAM_ASM_000147